MKISTKSLTILAMSIAIQVVLMYLYLIIPTLKFTLLFCISLINGCLCYAGMKKSLVILSYILTSLLAVLMINDISIYGFYILFFGYYGIIHSIGKDWNFWLKQLFRGIIFILACLIVYYLPIDFGIDKTDISILTMVLFFIYVAYQILYTFIIRELARRKLFSVLRIKN